MGTTYRRNTGWFVVLLVVFMVGGWGVLTFATAGSEAACNGGVGHIAWQWSPVPRFNCVVGPRF